MVLALPVPSAGCLLSVLVVLGCCSTLVSVFRHQELGHALMYQTAGQLGRQTCA